jgi:hypothetical protein
MMTDEAIRPGVLTNSRQRPVLRWRDRCMAWCSWSGGSARLLVVTG